MADDDRPDLTGMDPAGMDPTGTDGAGLDLTGLDLADVLAEDAAIEALRAGLPTSDDPVLASLAGLADAVGADIPPGPVREPTPGLARVTLRMFAASVAAVVVVTTAGLASATGKAFDPVGGFLEWGRTIGERLVSPSVDRRHAGSLPPGAEHEQGSAPRLLALPPVVPPVLPPERGSGVLATQPLHPEAAQPEPAGSGGTPAESAGAGSPQDRASVRSDADQQAPEEAALEPTGALPGRADAMPTPRVEAGAGAGLDTGTYSDPDAGAVTGTDAGTGTAVEAEKAKKSKDPTRARPHGPGQPEPESTHRATTPRSVAGSQRLSPPAGRGRLAVPAPVAERPADPNREATAGATVEPVEPTVAETDPTTGAAANTVTTAR